MSAADVMKATTVEVTVDEFPLKQSRRLAFFDKNHRYLAYARLQLIVTPGDEERMEAMVARIQQAFEALRRSEE